MVDNLYSLKHGGDGGGGVKMIAMTKLKLHPTVVHFQDNAFVSSKAEIK